MKKIKLITALTLALVYAVAPLTGLADEKKAEKVKPYTLDKCIVSDEKLGADPNMKPYVFTEGDREIKLCCKSCLKDFKKDSAKYIKKIEEAEKAAEKAAKK